MLITGGPADDLGYQQQVDKWYRFRTVSEQWNQKAAKPFKQQILA